MGAPTFSRRSACLLFAALGLSAACTPLRPSPTESPSAAIDATKTLRSASRPSPRAEPSRRVAITATPEPGPSPLAATPRPQCLRLPGRIEIGELVDPALPRSLPYRIYLPPCYRRGSGEPLSALYLLHGLQRTDSQWDDLGADEAAEKLIAAGESPPFLIVMPWERKGLDFEDTIVRFLLPFVESAYDASPARERRALGGISRGAGWALRIGLKHPQLFGALGLHSPAVLAPDLFELSHWVEAVPEGRLPALWIDIGERDTLRSSAMELAGQLDELGVGYAWEMGPGAHTEGYWSSHMESYMRWYVSQWAEGLDGGQP